MNTFDHQKGAYFCTGEAKIYYEEIGNPDKPVIIFLHGGVGNMEDFNVLVPLLADDFRIIGIDSRGQGKSSLGSDKLTYQLLQSDIEALLKSLNINNIIIIGFSDGGIISYRMAIENAIKIKKIVTIGATWNIKDLLATEEIFLNVTAAGWKEKFPDSFNLYQKLNPEPDFEKLIKSVVALWLDKTETGFPNERVSEINCPALIVRGDQDHLFSRKSVFEVAECIDNAALLNIPFAGHVAYEDQLELFFITLKQFLNEQ
ncbi:MULTISPECIES: alpha/beta fold hydrolase [Sphingobacterium]|nr:MULTISPECIES: alpha/beta hydrolase [Sphingobacterium]MCW2260027.1 pimeloyl-ACP methyl ester carboxylesterase [Sphingobacterium kitahiroshimense]TCR11179.1 pimeloyl-ACP methyl ester carboxylesterase [Sphingobacterium sp. JUb78]